MRVVAFVDGFNLYHSIEDQIHPPKNIKTAPAPKPKPQYRNYKWLNVQKLIEQFLPEEDDLLDIYFFTSIPEWNNERASRHKKYIQACKRRSNSVTVGGPKV